MGKFFDALKKSDEHRADRQSLEVVTDGEKKETPDEISNEVSPDSPAPSSGISDAEITDQSGATAGTPRSKSSQPPPEAQAQSAQRSHPMIDKNLIAYHAPHSLEAEQFRMLRTNILFPSTGKISPRTILVTSALPAEGKSFVSSNLAITIARNIDKHVLLIDCDMRHPTIHKNFGLANLPGLSNYLIGGYSLMDLLIRIEDMHLTILPGGPAPPNPAELLSSNRMLALLREVRERYQDRYIIIDSPPPHLTAESKALAQFVEGIILVVKFERTKRELVRQLVDKLPRKKIIGVVANWLNHRTTASYVSGEYAPYATYLSAGKTQ